MTLHHAGTFYVPEGETRTVRLPKLRDGNEEGRVLLASSRGEVYVWAYVEEADTDDLLMLNQYNAEGFIESVKAAVEYGDVDPSEGRWTLERTVSDRLTVEHHTGPSTASEAMGDGEE